MIGGAFYAKERLCYFTCRFWKLVLCFAMRRHNGCSFDLWDRGGFSYGAAA